MDTPYMRPSYSRLQRLVDELPRDFTARDLAAASGVSPKSCLRALRTLAQLDEARITANHNDPQLAAWRYGRPPLAPLTRAQQYEFRFIYDPLTVHRHRVVKAPGRIEVGTPDGRELSFAYEGKTRREVVETALRMRAAGLPV